MLVVGSWIVNSISSGGAPPEEIEFTIQERTTSKQDQITLIPAPSLHIDIPTILLPPPPGYKWQYHLCLVPVDTKPIQHANHLSSASWIEKRPKQFRKRLKKDRRQKEEDKSRRTDLRDDIETFKDAFIKCEGIVTFSPIVT